MAQTHSQKRSVEERLNTWMQIVGICIAAVWGVYTFVFKEITVPKSAPVNVTLNLQLKKVGTSAAEAGLIAVGMTASATNPSSREIHLLPSAWIAYGVSITTAERDDPTFNKKALTALADPENVSTVQRHAKRLNNSIVAMGRLFFNTALKPGETLVRNIVFYVPIGKYDLVNLISTMPNTTADPKRIELKWALRNNVLEFNAYQLDRTGKRILETAKNGSYGYSEAKVDQTEANTQISLWPGS
jgi:hypothetical protein